jgi:hypothetical protein
VPVAGLAGGEPGLAIAFVRRCQWIAFRVAQGVAGDPATTENVARGALERASRHAPVHDSRRNSIRA